MASPNENAPVCPNCGVSSGVHGEASVTFTWSRGAWRTYNEQPECLPDLCCSKCNYYGQGAEFFETEINP